MAKTDVPNDTQTKQTPEEWAVRRAIALFFMYDSDEYDPATREYLIKGKLAHYNDKTLAFSKADAIQRIARDFMQLTEEHLAIIDDQIAAIQDSPAQGHIQVAMAAEALDNLVAVRDFIRNLHTNA